VRIFIPRAPENADGAVHVAALFHVDPDHISELTGPPNYTGKIAEAGILVEVKPQLCELYGEISVLAAVLDLTERIDVVFADPFRLRHPGDIFPELGENRVDAFEMQLPGGIQGVGEFLPGHEPFYRTAYKCMSWKTLTQRRVFGDPEKSI